MASLADITTSQLLDGIYGNIALVRRAGHLTGTEDDCLFMALRATEELRERGGVASSGAGAPLRALRLP